MRLRLGISACLLGEPVRYDGGHKGLELLRERRDIEWIAVCPEAGAGLGVPREPIHLEATAAGLRVLGNTSRLDVTGRLRDFAHAELERLRHLGLAGYVTKARSPSCGLGDAPILAADGAGSPDLGDGLFMRALRRAMPRLPVGTEADVGTPAGLEAFLARARRFAASG